MRCVVHQHPLCSHLHRQHRHCSLTMHGLRYVALLCFACAPMTDCCAVRGCVVQCVRDLMKDTSSLPSSSYSSSSGFPSSSPSFHSSPSFSSSSSFASGLPLPTQLTRLFGWLLAAYPHHPLLHERSAVTRWRLFAAVRMYGSPE